MIKMEFQKEPNHRKGQFSQALIIFYDRYDPKQPVPYLW